MLSCAVDRGRASEAVHPAQDIIRLACRDVIEIQGDQVTADHAGRLAAVPFKRTADESADILQLILLGLRKRKVLF